MSRYEIRDAETGCGWKEIWEHPGSGGSRKVGAFSPRDFAEFYQVLAAYGEKEQARRDLAAVFAPSSEAPACGKRIGLPHGQPELRVPEQMTDRPKRTGLPRNPGPVQIPDPIERIGPGMGGLASDENGRRLL